MTTTSNTSTQTNQFQVSLKHGDYVLLTSNIFKNDKEVDSFIEILKNGNCNYVVNYITSVPKLEDVRTHLDSRHDSYSGSYLPFSSNSLGHTFSSGPACCSTPTFSSGPACCSTPTFGTEPVCCSTPTFGTEPVCCSTPTFGTAPTFGNGSSAFSPPPPFGNGSSAFSTPTISSSSPTISSSSHMNRSASVPVVSNSGLDLLCDAINFEEEGSEINSENMGAEGANFNEFEGMTIELCVDGYLLVPQENHPYYGINCLSDGWWIPTQKGWYIKDDSVEYFLENGASWKPENKDTNDSIVINPKIFDEMIFEDYDGKYLLQCYAEDTNYKNPNFHGGVWNKQADGWIFSNDMINFLEDNGAKYEDNSLDIFDDMLVVSCRGNGWKLIPSKENKFYGLDKFVGKGLWRESSDTTKPPYWFFPKETLEFFTSKGAEV